MELKKSSSPFFLVSAITSFLICILGVWWLFLLFRMSDRLSELETQTGPNIANLIKWEGSTFILLVLILVGSHTLLFIRDQRKNRSIGAFFAGLTHELKTPLASIKLQAEVLQNEAQKTQEPRLNKLTNRLIEDTFRLETQMDNILQLSRIERNGNLNLTEINLASFIKGISNSYENKIDVSIESTNDDYTINADQFALEIILKNLFQNTVTHTSSEKVDLSFSSNNEVITLRYDDHGSFDGDVSKLGKLFYKHESSKGSGIGLYLSKKLIVKMGGQLKITHNKGLVFELSFPKVNGGANV